VRAVAEDAACAGEDLVDDGGGLRGARGEGYVGERGEGRGGGIAEAGEGGRVEVRDVAEEGLAKVHRRGPPEVVEHQRVRAYMRRCAQPVRVRA